MGSSEPHSRNQKPRVKLFLPSCWHILKLNGDIFLSHIITANETWVMAWHHPQPHRKKVSRKSQTARKVMIAVI